MPEFNVRSDSVNVEQIMEQIRARIREKRGVDYTEQQIRDLAAVKLEKFLDPKGVRSDLLERYRRLQPAYEPPELPNYEFEDSTLYETHRGGLRFIRKLFNPLLKLFFNPNPLIQALHIQSKLNAMYAEREARREAARRATDQLTYELIHNLVVETTRLSIEVKNLKMRVESVGSRLEFNERRARALESVVAYKPGEGDVVAPPPRTPAPYAQRPPRPSPPPVQIAQPPAAPPQPQASQSSPAGAAGATTSPEGPGQRSRRRRRRRGRRGGGSAAGIMGGQAAPQAGAPDASGPGGDVLDDGADTDAMDESAESDATAMDTVVTNDLEQFSGAVAHPSEPVSRPDDRESAAVESTAAKSTDAAPAGTSGGASSTDAGHPGAASADAGSSPAKTDSDAQ